MEVLKTTAFYIQTGGILAMFSSVDLNNAAFVMNKERLVNVERQNNFEAFKDVFQNDLDQVRRFITAINYLGYFFPNPAPRYNDNIVESNLDLCNSINYYLNQDLSILYSQLTSFQGTVIMYNALFLNNDRWYKKCIFLDNNFYTSLNNLLSNMEDIQNDGKSRYPFWTKNKFSELVNAIDLINHHNPNAIIQINDYPSVRIITNQIRSDYKMENQPAEPLDKNSEPKVRQISSSEDSYEGNIFANMTINPFIDKLEANMDNAIQYLFYFTLGNKNIFDNLAKDFISLATGSIFKHRNTIVEGDLDKLNKWQILINDISRHVTFMSREPYIIPLNFQYSRKDCMEYVPLVGETLRHIYCQCCRNIHYPDPGNQYIHLNFPYGGRYYELPDLKRDDFIWIAELLFAHGWHLINGAQGSRKAKTRNIESEFAGFLNKCDENNDIRIPAALVYQLYTAYATKEKQTKKVSDSDLYTLIKENGIEYNTFKSRDADVDYITKELKPIMEKTGIFFDDKWTEKNRGNKSFKCTISDELWKKLTAPSAKTNQSSDEEKFSKYLKELFSRYENIFNYDSAILNLLKGNSDNSKATSEPIGTRYIKK